MLRGMEMSWAAAQVAWAWLRAAISFDRILRHMRALPYRGQPLVFSKKRGLMIVPRTSWRLRK